MPPGASSCACPGRSTQIPGPHAILAGVFLPPPSTPPASPSPPLPLPPLVLADVIDPTTGDAVSFLAGADPVEAALQWQFTVRQGSGSALGTNGHRLHTITKATPQAPMQLEGEVRRVAQKFVGRGQLADLDVAATVEGESTATGVIAASATNVIAERATQLVIGGA